MKKKRERNKDDGLYVFLQDEEGWRRTVWERNMEMIEQHNQEYSQGEHSFTLAMNAFGDMVSVAWIAEHFVLPLSILSKKISCLSTFCFLFLEDQ